MCTYANALRFWGGAFACALFGFLFLGGINYIKTGQVFAAQAATPAPTVLNLTTNDSGNSYFVAPGSTVEIRLPENMSTGYSWKLQTIEGDSVKLASETYTDKASIPGTDGTYSLKVTAGQSGQSVLTIVKTGRGSPNVVEQVIVVLIARTPPANAQEAAKMFTEEDMHLQCSINHIPDGSVDHIFIQGDYVLADWHCGRLHGEDAFQLVGGTAMAPKLVSIQGEDVQTKLTTDQLAFLGMDSAAAKKLLDQRDAPSH